MIANNETIYVQKYRGGSGYAGFWAKLLIARKKI
jgi:hypothetical protein